jgi:steroid 5-alpha reductase family enzyme
MNPQWWHLLFVAVGIALIMLILWVIQWRRQDASLVDASWSAGIGLGAILLLWLGDGDVVRRVIAGTMIGAWSFRLTWYLIRDRLIGKPEDGRYQMLRKSWGAQAQPWFFLFFQFQGWLVVFFSAPFVIIASTSNTFGAWYDILALVIWLTALSGETIADAQLEKWRNNTDNKGRTCRAGLWRYSRHPNYFCEWLLWFAYVALAASSAWWPITLIVPMVLLFLILKVTGIPYTEKRALASRGDDYRAYQRTTSAFIPWFPKSESAS